MKKNKMAYKCILFIDAANPVVSPWLVLQNSEYGIFFVCQNALILPGSW